MKVVVAGGGYAGLAAALALRRAAPKADIAVADPRPAHLKISRLHQTLRGSLARQQLTFATLAERLGFRFVEAAAELAPRALALCQQERRVALGGLPHACDYLLVASGACGVMPENPGEHCYGLEYFYDNPGRALLDDFVRRSRGRTQPAASVIGAGASGVQFAFELAAALREREFAARLRLVELAGRALAQQPPHVDRYVRERLDEAGIEFLPGREFISHRDGVLQLRGEHGEEQLPSQLCLLLLGRKPRPERLQADAYGRVLVDGKALSRVFAAGDCASFQGQGLDAPTAQAAIRKAQLVAANIVRAYRDEELKPYDYREAGYVVSLGDGDGAGWLLARDTPLTGLPAAAVKGLIETQYDLLLNGTDTYFDVDALRDKIARLREVL